jgi:glycosyltransferase involved in cell wall biosynthesis
MVQTSELFELPGHAFRHKAIRNARFKTQWVRMPKEGAFPANRVGSLRDLHQRSDGWRANVRIAVFHNLPSGGGKRALYNYVKHLKTAGHQIDVHVPSTANENFLPLKDIVDGFHAYTVPQTTRGALYSSFRQILPRSFDIKWTRDRIADEIDDLNRAQGGIADAINAGPYNVVFVEQDQLTMSPFLIRRLKKPTVYYCQQPSRVEEAILHEVVRATSLLAPAPALVPTYKRIWRAYLKSQEIPFAKIDRENASHAKYILANSCFSRETILRVYGLNSSVSYLGIDNDSFRPLSVPRENFVISVGECRPHKGFDFTIRSLGLIPEPHRPKLIIVSNTSDARWETYLVKTAARLRVELEIKTSIPDNELVCLYNRARLFVYAAILEPFGLAPLEAMACGTPVVAVKEGGVRESVLQNETGILTPRDERAFAEATMNLLENDEERERMGRRGVEVVQEFWTLRHAGERLEAHLREAVVQGNPGTGGCGNTDGC